MSKPVKIHEETYERLKRYSEITGVPIVTVLDKAIKDWFDTVGDTHLEYLQQQSMKVVSINGGTNIQTMN